jgi:hypothetical protein
MFHRLILAVVLLVAASSSARAEIILGNLVGSNDATPTGLHSNLHRAIAFSMGSLSFTLDSLILRLNYLSGTPVVQLKNDGGTEPGNTVVANFTPPPVNGGGLQNYTFTPNASTTLAANTTYWLEVSAVDDFNNPIQWSRSDPALTPTPAAATFLDSKTFSGGSWSGSTQINTFQLNGTQVSAVPEPTSFLLVAGLAEAGGLRRRFTRR